MKTVFLALTLMSLAKADVGSGKLVNCSNSQMKFEVYNTAVPTLKQGYLTFKGETRPTVLTCKEPKEEPMTGADLLTTHYSCVETRNGDGKFLVNVISGGLLGVFRAEVKIEQIFPLKPKTIASIQCSEPEEDLERHDRRGRNDSETH